MSCCGQGGSWFGNCGGTGGIKLGHTWHEGLQACKIRAQSKTVVKQHLNDAQQESNGFFDGDNNPKSKTVSSAVKPLTFSSAQMLNALAIRTPATTFRAYGTSTTNSKPITPATIAITSTPANVSLAALVTSTANVSITPSLHISKRHSSYSVLMTALVHRLDISTGCKPVLDVTVYISLSLTATLF